MGSNVALGFTPKESYPDHFTSQDTDLIFKAKKVEMFTPRGQERTHVGFVIKGNYKNTAGEKIQLPEIAFRIRKSAPENPASAKELNKVLLALNDFIELHKTLSKEDFEMRMHKLDGLVMRFCFDENTDSLLNRRSRIKRFFNKSKPVTRTWFLAEKSLDPGRAEFMHNKIRKEFFPLHPLREAPPKDLSDIAEGLFERDLKTIKQPQMRAEAEAVPAQDFVKASGWRDKAEADKESIRTWVFPNMQDINNTPTRDSSSGHALDDQLEIT